MWSVTIYWIITTMHSFFTNTNPCLWISSVHFSCIVFVSHTFVIWSSCLWCFFKPQTGTCSVYFRDVVLWNESWRMVTPSEKCLAGKLLSLDSLRWRMWGETKWVTGGGGVVLLGGKNEEAVPGPEVILQGLWNTIWFEILPPPLAFILFSSSFPSK